jgi:sugar O-acyltransferase (sialic acid O-acetyltransferase NeuD family)
MKVIFLGAANPETGRMIQALQRIQPNFCVLGFIDNDPLKKGKTFVGYPVLGGFEVLNTLVRDDVFFVNLITRNTKTRYETSRQLAQSRCRFANFIHPSVDLSMTTTGVGNYIQEGVIVQAGVHIGNNSSIHIGTLVGHETVIGDSVFIAHGCRISGCVQIADGTFVGTGAVVVPRLRIGKWSMINAGSVVVKDVPDYATVAGNPARVVGVGDPTYADGNIFA